MVVSTQHHRSLQFSRSDGSIHRQCNVSSAYIVSIEDAGLASNDELICPCLLNPAQVVVDLLSHVFVSAVKHAPKDIRCNFIGPLQIGRVAARANPTVRAKTVVEAQRAHDVLDVGGITEGPVFVDHISTNPGGLQEESIAIIPEVHPAFCHGVDGGRVAPKGGLYLRPKSGRVFGQHRGALLVGSICWEITSLIRVVQAGLIAPQIHVNLSLHASFP